MIETKAKTIRQFFEANASAEIVNKYERYFKDGYDGFGIEQKIFDEQRDLWVSEWDEEMSLDDYLTLGDYLMKNGRLEEKTLAMFFVKGKKENYNLQTFEKIGQWLELYIDNWASTDVLCMLVTPSFFMDDILPLNQLSDWNNASSEWKRRAIPVTLVELLKHDLQPDKALPLIEPLMLDDSEYVQKGIGTLLRGLWKKYPTEIEAFLLKWKDQCGRLIIQYACEKMDKEYRKQFRKQRTKK